MGGVTRIAGKDAADVPDRAMPSVAARKAQARHDVRVRVLYNATRRDVLRLLAAARTARPRQLPRFSHHQIIIPLRRARRLLGAQWRAPGEPARSLASEDEGAGNPQVRVAGGDTSCSRKSECVLPDVDGSDTTGA